MSSRPIPRASLPAMPPGPLPRSARSSPRPHPEPPHCCVRACKRATGCPRDRSCRRAHRSGKQAPPSPCNRASSEGSGFYLALPGSSPITIPHHLRKRTRSQGPLLRRHYPASTLQRPCPPPPLPPARTDVEAAPLARNGSPLTTTNHLSDVLCPLPRRIERVRVSITSPLVQHSPYGRRVCIRIDTFEACSGFTRVTARRIAQPPKVTFVT